MNSALFFQRVYMQNVLLSISLLCVSILSLTISCCPPLPGSFCGDNGNNSRKPDLTISSFTISPPSPESGKHVQVSMTVQNLGKAPAGRFSVRWRPLEGHSGILQEISGLSSNESKTLAFEYVYVNAGTFQSEAAVDVQNAIDEFNEANNTNVRAINVVNASNADLWIKEFSLDPAESEVRKKVRAEIVVENAGPGPAGNFVVMWRPYEGHTGLTKPISGLNARQPQSLTFEFVYSNSGIFQTEAIVDVNHQVTETDEANSRTQGITIRPGEPEYMTYEIRIKTGGIKKGGTDANVYILFWGEKRGGEKVQSDEFELDNDADNFERNNTDIFPISTEYLGSLTKLRIRHDNTGKDKGWFLDYIEVQEKQGDMRTWKFPCYCWLADDEGDRKIERELSPR